MFTPTTFASILPEILILALGMLVLIVEPFWKEEQRRNVGWLTAGGLLISMVISLLFGQPGTPTSTLGGMVRFSWLACLPLVICRPWSRLASWRWSWWG